MNFDTKLDCIIFDFDGVLAESVAVKGEAFYDLYAYYGPDIQNKVLAHHLAHGGVSRFDKIKHYDTEFLNRPEPSEARMDEMANKFSRLVEDKVVASAWVAGAREFLERWSSNIPLFVASATPQEELERIIEKRDMTTFFKEIFGSPTKKAVHLNDIAARYGFSKNKMMMIGDTMSDYTAAQDAGTLFIGRHIADNPANFPDNTVVIDDLNGLEEALNSIPLF